jgi:hypothetical protein
MQFKFTNIMVFWVISKAFFAIPLWTHFILYANSM